MSDEAISSGEDSATVTLILPGATGLGVGFPVRLNCILLGALVTLPFLLPMFSAEMLLYPCKIT